MQTFVPYPDVRRSAQSLDRQRLGKQRVECWQILLALKALRTGDLYTTDKRGKLRKRGWVSHPCTAMWQGHEGYLAYYAFHVCSEWIRRGYKDNMRERFIAIMQEHNDMTPPAWWGREDIHVSHQANLVRKDPAHYELQFPNANPDMEYVWS
jgi:hypothetical protein